MYYVKYVWIQLMTFFVITMFFLTKKVRILKPSDYCLIFEVKENYSVILCIDNLFFDNKKKKEE